ncbi:MAG: hypothetical protein M1821_008261 [Bathelium mastoideum]|nr:MAG: hypothetical protein M1821_008261 [Bathelium mastoideum]KAI9693301.1 MAG: hypothetical protein M1822_005297 [Bathelium mastoideum]
MLCSHSLTSTYTVSSRAIRSFHRFNSLSGRRKVEDSHTDSRSFEAYANKVNLNRESTVYRGTRYEYTAIDALRRFHFELKRQGGRDDLGIDLSGTWNLSTLFHPVRVIVSCKSNAKTAEPKWIRELEGAFAGDPQVPANGKVAGFLVARGEATSSLREALTRSQSPLGFVNITLEGDVRQMLWNERLADMGLERVTPKVWNRESDSNQTMAHQESTTIVLMENGTILDRVYGNQAKLSS